MFRSGQDSPLIDSIRSKVDQVVRLLFAEWGKQSTEHWEDPCKRVTEKAGVSVFLSESLHDWTPANSPHGNTHLTTGLRDSFVVVTDYRGEWRVAFKLRDWSLLDDDNGSGEQNAEPGGKTESDAITTADIHASTIKDGDATIHQTGASDIGTAPTDQSENRSRAPSHAAPPVYNEAYLIREFDRRERERGPIFAGFIVNDLLLRMGFSSADAKRILRAMEAQDMVRTESKLNPKHPERPATFVTLNHDHPTVRRVLGENGRSKKFQPVPIRGEPLSATIIRERR